jgi:hypothetical protein
LNPIQNKNLTNDDEITIIDQEGKILVNRLPDPANAENLGKKLAELGSHLLTGIQPALSRAHLQGIESILIQGERGKLCILSSEQGKFFITLVGNIQ